MDLTALPVELEQLFLDPANPRLITLKDEELPEYEDCYVAQSATQQEVVDRLRHEVGFEDLKAKIRRLGFLPIDRIVARPLECEDPGLLPSKGGYVVLEGNRRVAALKSISGGAAVNTLPPEIKKTISPIEVLIYHGDDPKIAWTIQGLRHIAQSIREWGAYQQARYLHDMLDGQDLTVADLNEATGFKPSEINRQDNAYRGFLQAREDEAYGQQLEEKDFSIFSEGVFAKPSLRTWLGWDPSTKQFANAARLATLIELIKDETSGAARIPRVNPDLRDKFGKLTTEGYGSILDAFLNGELGLEEAMDKVREQDATSKVHHSQVDIASRRQALEDADTQVQTLPVPAIRKSAETLSDFRELVTRLRDSCNGQLEVLEALGSDGDGQKPAGEPDNAEP